MVTLISIMVYCILFTLSSSERHSGYTSKAELKTISSADDLTQLFSYIRSDPTFCKHFSGRSPVYVPYRRRIGNNINSSLFSSEKTFLKLLILTSLTILCKLSIRFFNASQGKIPKKLLYCPSCSWSFSGFETAPGSFSVSLKMCIAVPLMV